MNMEHVGIALEIMGKGMGGIFAAIIIIMAAVMVLGSITKDHKDDNKQAGKSDGIDRKIRWSCQQEKNKQEGLPGRQSRQVISGIPGNHAGTPLAHQSWLPPTVESRKSGCCPELPETKRQHTNLFEMTINGMMNLWDKNAKYRQITLIIRFKYE